MLVAVVVVVVAVVVGVVVVVLVGQLGPAPTDATLAATDAVHYVYGVRAVPTPTVSWGRATRAPVLLLLLLLLLLNS